MGAADVQARIHAGHTLLHVAFTYSHNSTTECPTIVSFIKNQKSFMNTNDIC
jgi:hypothetical protein